MSQPRPHRRIVKFPQGVAAHKNISDRTVRNYAKNQYFKLYRIAGQKGLFCDLDEVDAAMAKIPASKARAGYGSYGGATIETLPPRAIVVNDRLGDRATAQPEIAATEPDLATDVEARAAAANLPPLTDQQAVRVANLLTPWTSTPPTAASGR